MKHEKKGRRTHEKLFSIQSKIRFSHFLFLSFSFLLHYSIKNMDRIAEFKAQANKMNKTLKKTYQKILSLKRLLQKRGNKPSAPEQKKLSALTR